MEIPYLISGMTVKAIFGIVKEFSPISCLSCEVFGVLPTRKLETRKIKYARIKNKRHCEAIRLRVDVRAAGEKTGTGTKENKSKAASFPKKPFFSSDPLGFKFSELLVSSECIEILFLS